MLQSRSLAILATAQIIATACGRQPVDTLRASYPEPPGGTVPDAGSTPVRQQCGPVRLSVDVQPIEGMELFDHATVPAVDANGVYVVREGTQFTNSPDDSEIFRYDPLTEGEHQLTRNDVHDLVIDARQGVILYRSGSGTAPQQLIYLDAFREVVLDADVDYPTHPFDLYDGADRRQVGMNRAAWLDASRDTIFHFNGTEVVSVSSGLTRNSRPDVGGAYVTWTAFDGTDTEVYLATPDGTERITDDDVPDYAPVITQSTVLWLAGPSIVIRDRRAGTVRVIHEGPCSAPSAHLGKVVFACSDTSDRSWPTPGDVLFLYDGDDDSLTQIPTSSHVYAPRVYNDRIAWLGFDDPEEFCTGGQSSGTVFLFDLKDTPSPLEVAPVGAGCWCCGDYWPPPKLTLAGDFLAWSYAARDEPIPDRIGTTSFGFVRRQRDCPDPSGN